MSRPYPDGRVEDELLEGDPFLSVPARSARNAPRRRVEIWRVIVGFSLIVALVGFAGPRQLLHTFSGLSLYWAVLTIVVLCGWLVLGGINVWILLRRLAPVPLRTFLAVYLNSWALSQVLPGQLGDATQILFLRRHGVPAIKSGTVYLVDKSVSLVWVVTVACFGLGLIIPLPFPAVWLVPLPTAALITALFAGRRIHRWQPRSGSLIEKCKEPIDKLLDQLWALREFPGSVALNAVLTIFKWLVVSLKYWLAFRSFGVLVPAVAAVTVPVTSSLVGYLPITVSGAGTVEWTAVGLFGHFKISSQTTVSAYLFLRAVLLLLAALVTWAVKMLPTEDVDSKALA